MKEASREDLARIWQQRWVCNADLVSLAKERVDRVGGGAPVSLLLLCLEDGSHLPNLGYHNLQDWEAITCQHAQVFSTAVAFCSTGVQVEGDTSCITVSKMATQVVGLGQGGDLILLTDHCHSRALLLHPILPGCTQWRHCQMNHVVQD